MMRRRHEWFQNVFGFHEPRTFEKVQQCFRVQENAETHEVVLHTVPPHNKTTSSRSFFVGKFETPSVLELRERLENTSTAQSPSLSFQHITGDVGELHKNPFNKNAIFQAASQFNCLEMPSPHVTPESGVTNYAWDRTQGPACALACPAALIYRNYFYHDGQGQSKRQIDMLHDVGVLLDNDSHKYWKMQNGYCLPTSSAHMLALKTRLQNNNDLTTQLKDSIRVGVHWSTEVYNASNNHNVTQIYCSALPCGYSDVSKDDWEPFAKIVLNGLYEATFGAAAVISQEHNNNNDRVKLYLTMVGGGVFANKPEWIISAIQRSLKLFQHFPMDVYLVHYGQIDYHYQMALPTIVTYAAQCYAAVQDKM